MKLTIKQVETQLRAEGVALGKYSGYYEFWNIKQHDSKKGCWRGVARNLNGVLEEYKNYTDSNIKKEGKRRHDLINKLKFPSI